VSWVDFIYLSWLISSIDKGGTDGSFNATNAFGFLDTNEDTGTLFGGSILV